MVVAFRDLISRADSAWLQQHVGADAVRVLQALEPNKDKTAGLRAVFLTLIAPHDALADPGVRSTLIELLRQSEVDQLCKALGITGSFEELSRVNFQRKSLRFERLCAFLGLPPLLEKPTHQPSAAVERVDPTYGLFEHQRAAVRRARARLDSQRKRVVLHMPTGAGKTRMAMHLVCEELASIDSGLVVWLANSEELCDQAADEFIKAWRSLGTREVNVFRFWGARQLNVGSSADGLLVAGFPKMYSMAKGATTSIAQLGDKTNLLVIDEAHQAIAPTYQTVIEGLSARRLDMKVLGLTATPGRTWNDPEADRKLAAFFERQKVTLDVEGYTDPIDFLVKQGFLAQPTFRKIMHNGGELSPGELAKLAGDLDIPASILRKLADDERRTVKIVREIEDLLTRHSRLIVFATTVAHAAMTSAILTVRGIAAKHVTGETEDELRSSSIAWFKQPSDDKRVIVNFGVLTTGFDAPRTSAVLIARPTRSLVLYSQMVGRAIRGPRAGGNASAEVVTVVDTTLPGFGSVADAFANWEDVW